MSIELAAGIVALILALVGGGVGWRQIRRHGREKALRQYETRRADDAEERERQDAQPPLTGSQGVSVLRLLRQRRMRSWWSRSKRLP